MEYLLFLPSIALGYWLAASFKFENIATRILSDGGFYVDKRIGDSSSVYSKETKAWLIPTTMFNNSANKYATLILFGYLLVLILTTAISGEFHEFLRNNETIPIGIIILPFITSFICSKLRIPSTKYVVRRMYNRYMSNTELQKNFQLRRSMDRKDKQRYEKEYRLDIEKLSGEKLDKAFKKWLEKPFKF